jgi:hypothetical protein
MNGMSGYLTHYYLCTKYIQRVRSLPMAPVNRAA